MTTPFIQCTNVTHGYIRGDQEITVLQNLNLAIEQGDFVALMGPSGSGKSTLLNLIAGLEAPDEGEISVGGVIISALREQTLADWRAQTLGFIFQFYNLIPVLSALDNVALPLMLTSLSRKERSQRAEAALEIVELANRAKHKPSELSGGQQQRVAIARALVSDPSLLVCDEPTGDLDRASANETLRLLGMLNRDFGKTVFMVTHDPEAASFAQATWHMDKGALQQQSTKEAI
jgi:putative ABC transport system ATP-binding protein